jgi:AbrB family looped-hinge helix DNA binding protein
MESALTTKGQATIPKAIREHLHLKPGDRVKFFVHPDGSVVLTQTSGGCLARHREIEAPSTSYNYRDE